MQSPILGAIRNVQLLLYKGKPISTSNRIPVQIESEITVENVWIGIPEGADLSEEE